MPPELPAKEESGPEGREAASRTEAVIRSSPVSVLDGEYVVARLATPPPAGTCLALVNDVEEVTAVAPAGEPWLGEATETRGPFRVLRLAISTPFTAPGFIAAATNALARIEVNVFVVSTFSFDYVLVEAGDLTPAVEALRRRGFPVDAG